jgi:hypothetical protein
LFACGVGDWTQGLVHRTSTLSPSYTASSDQVKSEIVIEFNAISKVNSLLKK